MALMISRYGNFLYSFRHNSVTGSYLLSKKRLRFRILVCSMKQHNIVNISMLFKKGKEFARIDGPAILGLCMKYVCPINEYHCSAFEIEKRRGHATCDRTSCWGIVRNGLKPSIDD